MKIILNLVTSIIKEECNESRFNFYVPPIECGIATYTKYLTEALRDKNTDVYIVSHMGVAGEQVFPDLTMKTVIWRTKRFP
jgi:hypothetical protein